MEPGERAIQACGCAAHFEASAHGTAIAFAPKKKPPEGRLQRKRPATVSGSGRNSLSRISAIRHLRRVRKNNRTMRVQFPYGSPLAPYAANNLSEAVARRVIELAQMGIREASQIEARVLAIFNKLG